VPHDQLTAARTPGQRHGQRADHVVGLFFSPGAGGRTALASTPEMNATPP
jgi:hypothetical protein